MISILLNGIGGQMGHVIYRCALEAPDAFSVLAGSDAYANAADFDCPVYARIGDVFEKADVIIDFSAAAALPEVVSYAVTHKTPLLVGTTGLTEDDHALLDRASETIPVFQSGNLSLGINLLMKLARDAAIALGSSFDTEIIETHHRRKLDSPSGTAEMLANVLAHVRDGETDFVYGRHVRDTRRSANEIGIHSVRGGTVVGEHEVLFLGPDETVTISHTAGSKRIFAAGALRAAAFLVTQAPGRYNMQDVFDAQEQAHEG